MLQRIDLTDWKSFRAAALEVRPLTVLVGTNASGKSNALEGLQLLAWLASGQRLSELPHAIRTGQVRIRGTVDQLFRKGARELRLGCQIASAGTSDPELTLAVALALEPDGALRIASEKLTAHGELVPLYSTQPSGSGADLIVAYNNFAKGRKPQLTATSAQAVFTQLGTPARFNEKHLESQKRIPRAVERVRSALASVLFLDPVPARMRGWVPKVEGKKLLPDGSNVSAVLYELLSRPGGAGRRAVLEFIGKLPDHDIVDIDFLETARAEVMLKVTETHGGAEGTAEEWDAGVVSDGTLRVLSIAAALLSAGPGATVVIEEVDNGVHPSRAESLLGPMLEHAEQRGLHVLISTHNPALLDAIPPRSLGDVVGCYRVAGASRLVALGKLHRFAEIAARGPLGQLVRARALDTYLRDERTEDEIVRDLLAWERSFSGTSDPR